MAKRKIYIITGKTFFKGLGMLEDMVPFNKANSNQLKRCPRVEVRGGKIIKRWTTKDFVELDNVIPALADKTEAFIKEVIER